MFKNLMTVAALSAFALPSAAVFAAKTGVLTVTGKVPESCELVVLESGNGKRILDLSKGAKDLNIGTVSEKCNDPNGYTVTIQFKNGKNGKDAAGLFRDSVSRATVPFTIAYNGKKVTDATVTDSNVRAVDFIKKDVRITYQPDATLPSSEEFTYFESMRFTIAAK